MSHQQRAEEFLKTSDQFQLGHLPTEWPHHKTVHLSDWAKNDLPQGIAALKEVDLLALEKFAKYLPEIEKLCAEVTQVLNSGGRIFLCGCGATGRLSLTLEYLWRECHPKSEQVISFMAGGDIALVHSLEGFEDYPEYGARHLQQLGFTERDMLISTTEGGETSYVIGATQKAAEISQHSTYFLFCNPKETLINHIQRSKEVIENPQVTTIELFVGPMALAGSTRMQASTVLQLAVGLALLEKPEDIAKKFLDFKSYFENLDYGLIEAFVVAESAAYKRGQYILYQTTDYPITVFTDTTERAPTFNLASFEVAGDQAREPSLCYVSIPSCETSWEAWKALLGHEPRPLNWEVISLKTTEQYQTSFNFGRRAERERAARLNGGEQILFSVLGSDGKLSWSLDGREASWVHSGLGSLYEHLALKVLLNAHSTLLMGRLDRYRNNIMTWVNPTNSKLIDRAARYILHLMDETHHGGVNYSDVVRELFRQLEDLDSKSSIVERSFEALVTARSGQMS